MRDLATSVAKATWTIDAGGLRETLDRLHRALGEAQNFSPPAVEPLEYQLTAGRLRELLERLGSIDLSKVPIGGTRGGGHPAEQLREVFDKLQWSLKAYVTNVLSAEKVEILFRLLSSSVPDFLHIIGKGNDENAHSDVIAWLLDPRRAPTVARHALRRLALHLPDEAWRSHLAEAVATESISIRREVVIAKDFENAADLSRIDIVICSPKFMLAIENKIWSREHSDQTRTYWQWLQSMNGLRGGILLSPSGMAASCPEFSSISYLDLVSCLLEGATIEPLTSSEEILLASYLKTLAREITQVEMRAILELAIEDKRPT